MTRKGRPKGREGEGAATHLNTTQYSRTRFSFHVDYFCGTLRSFPTARGGLLFDECSGSDYIRFFPGGGEVIRLLLGAPGGREGTPVSRKGANYLKKLTENTNLYRLTA